MSFLTNCFVETLIAKCCRLYNVFGSGASHGAHAQFIAQSAIANKGRRVGLLRGATTRMASCHDEGTPSKGCLEVNRSQRHVPRLGKE